MLFYNYVFSFSVFLPDQNTNKELALNWNYPEFVQFQEISLPQYSMLPDVDHGTCIDETRISSMGRLKFTAL